MTTEALVAQFARRHPKITARVLAETLAKAHSELSIEAICDIVATVIASRPQLRRPLAHELGRTVADDA